MTQVSQLPSQPLLQISHLVKSYDGVKPALDDVSFSIRRGEFVSVIGPSGAGASSSVSSAAESVPTASARRRTDHRTAAASRHPRRRGSPAPSPRPL